MAVHKIFVYGTLKRNQRNHYLMTDERNGKAVFLGEGKLINSHPLVVRRSEYVHPTLLPQSSKPCDNVVYGELYEVDSSMLEVLDRLERHPTWYIRTQTQCILKTTSDGASLSEDNVVDCEVYIFKNPEPELYSLPYISCYDDSM